MKVMNNPYNILFGKTPPQSIKRGSQHEKILNSFLSEQINDQIYIITGLRGTGKTVLMTEVSKEIEKLKDWIVVDLNPNDDLRQDLLSKLYNRKEVNKLIRSAKISFSFHNILELEVDSKRPEFNCETDIANILKELAKKKKRVLITIDEITSSKQMKSFASSFQSFMRQDLPVFLLMTGLYENINKLQNEGNLTFLYRAPKIELSSLSTNAIINNYMTVLGTDQETAREMAWKTNGYPYAFQLLGYLTWDNGGNYQDILPLYEQYLEDAVYSVIWSSLPAKEKFVAYGIARSEHGKTKEIREILKMESNEFSPYRERLSKRNLINTEETGYISFTLPLFDKFILNNYRPEI